MTPVLVKFCGITRAVDADAAAQLGAAAVGFVFAPGSPRFIAPAQAAIIRRRVPPATQAVALFKDAADQQVREAIEAVRPDVLQFHGDETPEFCHSFGLPYWRAVPMGAVQDLTVWSQRFSSARALLLDAHAPGERGGQGVRFDWNAVSGASLPLVLAGGLTPDNVFEAVRRVRPFGVDVSSGIEAAPGIKDHAKMQRFIDEVRRAQAG